MQDGDQVEQAERGDAYLAGLLPQGVVVAPKGELAVLGDGDRVGRGAGCGGQLACLRGGGGGLEGLGPGNHQLLLLSRDGLAVDGPVGCQRGGVGGGRQVPHVIAGQLRVADGGAGDDHGGAGKG